MRVIAGFARGKKLQPVPGLDTRPTTDRVKENMFNIVQNQLRDAQVLDLFAGTGQLGIEAASRGAAHVDFVEQSRAAAQVLRKNLVQARAEQMSTVHLCSASQFITKCSKNQYDIIFLDPPYGGVILQNTLFIIERFDILHADGIIICESASADQWQSAFPVRKSYRYGATTLTVLQALKPIDEDSKS